MRYNILDYFQETINKYGDKTAVIEGDNFISFEILNIKSKILASTILNNSNLKNNPIAVFLPKSINSVIANITITYSSNIYMHLDIKNPKERILNIINLINPPVIITNSIYFNDFLFNFNNFICACDDYF